MICRFITCSQNNSRRYHQCYPRVVSQPSRNSLWYRVRISPKIKEGRSIAEDETRFWCVRRWTVDVSADTLKRLSGFFLLIFQSGGGCENKPRVIPVKFTPWCVSNVFDLIKYARGVQLSSGFLSANLLRAFFREFLLSQAPPLEAKIRGISQDHSGKHW